MTDDHDQDIDWQAEADALAAYLDSRVLPPDKIVVLMCWALAATARGLSDSDEQTRAAVAHLSRNMERLAGLAPPTQQ